MFLVVVLQEILTIKSDDVAGRAKTYEAIVKNEDILQSGVPESFKVLIMELRSLGLAVEVLSEEEKMPLPEEDRKVPESGAWLKLDEGPVQNEEERVTLIEGLGKTPEPEAGTEPDEGPTQNEEERVTLIEGLGKTTEPEAEIKPDEDSSQSEVEEDNA